MLFTKLLSFIIDFHTSEVCQTPKLGHTSDLVHTAKFELIYP